MIMILFLVTLSDGYIAGLFRSIWGIFFATFNIKGIELVWEEGHP